MSLKSMFEKIKEQAKAVYDEELSESRTERPLESLGGKQAEKQSSENYSQGNYESVGDGADSLLRTKKKLSESLRGIVESLAVDYKITDSARESIHKMVDPDNNMSFLVDVVINEILTDRKDVDEYREGLSTFDSLSAKLALTQSLYPDNMNFFSSNNEKRRAQSSMEILNCIIPKEKEDMFNLLSSIKPLANRLGPKDYIDDNANDDYSLAWWRLYDSALTTARRIFPNDPDLEPFISFYESEINKKSTKEKILGKFFK